MKKKKMKNKELMRELLEEIRNLSIKKPRTPPCPKCARTKLRTLPCPKCEGCGLFPFGKDGETYIAVKDSAGCVYCLGFGTLTIKDKKI